MYFDSFSVFSLLSLYLHTHSLSAPFSLSLLSVILSLSFFLSLSRQVQVSSELTDILNAKRVVSSQLYNINMKYTTCFPSQL